MSTFSWRYERADSVTVTPEAFADLTFVSQADAETWVGETWRDLVAAGVEQVSLLRDGELVYGPMSLNPVP